MLRGICRQPINISELCSLLAKLGKTCVPAFTDMRSKQAFMGRTYFEKNINQFCSLTEIMALYFTLLTFFVLEVIETRKTSMQTTTPRPYSPYTCWSLWTRPRWWGPGWGGGGTGPPSSGSSCCLGLLGRGRRGGRRGGSNLPDLVTPTPSQHGQKKWKHYPPLYYVRGQ